MSSSFQAEIKCPNCNETSRFVIWRSINTVLDPEMKQAVRDGSAFLFNCPRCQHATHVEYDVLYHQMEDQIMIQVASTEEGLKRALSCMSGEDRTEIIQMLRKDSHYLNRIVRTQNNLREKLAIFDCGYDDRIVEIYKLLLFARIQEQNPKYRAIELLFFRQPEGECGIQLMAEGKPVGMCRFDVEMYRKLEAVYLPALKEIREEQPVVDRGRALEAMRLAHAENWGDAAG